jgi:hypothetical protein
MESHLNGRPKPPLRRRHWKHIHHSPWFWVGAAMFVLAITVYIMSDDLSWRPWMRRP